MGLASDALPVDYKHEFDNSEDGDTACERDNVYYLQNVVFVVEGCLFKVPIYSFERGSLEMRAMITSAFGGAEREPTNTVKLDGISKIDFKRLLMVMYPLEIKPRPMSLPEWTSTLRLSTLWKFAAIRELAIERIATFDIEPTDKIVLSQEFDVVDWYEPACEELSVRFATLTMEEAKKIGLETAVRVFHARERSRHCGCSATTEAASSSTSPIALNKSLVDIEGGEATATVAVEVVNEDRAKKDEQKHAEGAHLQETEDAPRVPEANVCRFAKGDVATLEKEEAVVSKKDKYAATTVDNTDENSTFARKPEEREVAPSVTVKKAEENEAASKEAEYSTAAAAKKTFEEEAAAVREVTKEEPATIGAFVAKRAKDKDVAAASTEKVAANTAAGKKAEEEVMDAKKNTLEKAKGFVEKKEAEAEAEAEDAQLESGHLAKAKAYHLVKQESCLVNGVEKEDADHLAKEETRRLAREKADRLVEEEAGRVASHRLARMEAHNRAQEARQQVAGQLAAEADRLSRAKAAHLVQREADRLFWEEAGRELARREVDRAVSKVAGNVDAESHRRERSDHYATVAAPNTAAIARHLLRMPSNEDWERKKAVEKRRLAEWNAGRAAARPAPISLSIPDVGFPEDPLDEDLKREAAKARSKEKERRRLGVQAGNEEASGISVKKGGKKKRHP